MRHSHGTTADTGDEACVRFVPASLASASRLKLGRAHAQAPTTTQLRKPGTTPESATKCAAASTSRWSPIKGPRWMRQITACSCCIDFQRYPQGPVQELGARRGVDCAAAGPSTGTCDAYRQQRGEAMTRHCRPLWEWHSTSPASFAFLPLLSAGPRNRVGVSRFGKFSGSSLYSSTNCGIPD
jgi:hypothetical protein